jgi:hypothetical protein
MSDRPVVFSASSVSAYLDCHLRWFFGYILNEKGEQSEAQRVGIAVHDYAERMLKGLAKVREGSHARPVPTPTGLADLARVFDHDILPTYRDPVLIEAAFQIEVNGVPFSGIIDSVDRQDMPPPGPFVDWDSEGRDMIDPYPFYANILRDLKTTGSRPKAGRYRFNMIGYWLGARELGHEAAIMQLDYIVRTLKPYYWPEVVAAPDEDEIEWFAATLQAVADGVGRADYEPTGVGTRVCSYCSYKAICGPYQRYKEVTQ